MIPIIQRSQEPSLADLNADLCRPLNDHVLVWHFITQHCVLGPCQIQISGDGEEANEQTLFLTWPNGRSAILHILMKISYQPNALRNPLSPPLKFSIVSANYHHDGICLKISSSNRSKDFQKARGPLSSAFFFQFRFETPTFIEVRYSSLVKICGKTMYNNLSKQEKNILQVFCEKSPLAGRRRKRQKTTPTMLQADLDDDVDHLAQQFDSGLFLSPEDKIRPIQDCFRFAIGNAPCRMDIRKASNPVEFTIADLLGDGLYRVNCNSEVVASMCTNMQYYERENIVIFTIRNDARWSDGTLVTAVDFVESWKNVLKYHRELGIELVSHLFFIHNAKEYSEQQVSEEHLGIRLIDDTTFYIVTSRFLSASFLTSIVARPPFLPVHSSYRNNVPYELRGFEDTSQELRPYIGCGPFCIDVEHTNSTTVVLGRNEFFWNRQYVYFKTIEMKRWSEHMEYLQYHAGHLDICGSPECEFVSGRARMKGERCQPIDSVYMLIFDTRHPVWRHQLLRQTIAHCIDRKDIISKLQNVRQYQFYGFEPARGLVPRAPSYMSETARTTVLEYDPKKALQCFAKFVYEDYLKRNGQEPTKSEINFTYMAQVTNENFTLSTVNQTIDKGVADMIIEQLHTKLKFVPWNTDPKDLQELVAQYRNQNYQVCRRFWFADFFDPTTFLALFKDGNGRTNNSYWEDGEYTRVVEELEQYSAIGNQAKVEELIERAEKIILEAAPVIPLFHAKKVYYLKPYVNNVGYTRLNFLSIVYGNITYNNINVQSA